MDTEFARTFLVVVAAGNFVNAASRLHITQSTVSARIQALERQLGATLFRRGRGGVELTTAGQRFLHHAKNLIRTLEQARHDIGQPDGFRGTLTIRSRIALLDGFLPRWAGWMRSDYPEIALRLEIGFEEDIIQGVMQGTVDLGLLYTPQNRSGLGVEYMFDERLLLVSTAVGSDWLNDNYVHIDWGAEFETQFATHFPDTPPPALYANIGWAALQKILCSGGSGFFPARLVQKLISEGRLHRVPDSPVFSLPAYLVFATGDTSEILHRALDGLRELASEERERKDLS
jgi:LysR family transcriptional regulator, flagellar master operon regulator